MMIEQTTLTNEEVRECPKCKKVIKVWEVMDKLYGFCDKCVMGWDYEN